MIFLENICSNPNILTRNENIHKIKNFLSSIDRKNLMFYKRNSEKLLEISKKIERLPLSNPVERKNGKRKRKEKEKAIINIQKSMIVKK